jgi:hypothetical protein
MQDNDKHSSIIDKWEKKFNNMDSSSSQPVKYLIPEGSSEDCPFLGRFEEEKEKQKEVGNEKQKLDEDSKNNKGKKRIFSPKFESF